MESFTIIGCVAVAIICGGQMCRPVSRAEKAELLDVAEGDEECERIADEAVEQKWLMWTQYEAVMQRVRRIKARREADRLLAESAARKSIRKMTDDSRN